MKKIGVQNIFIAAVILIVAMVAVNVVSLTMLDGFVKDILVERANVGMSVQAFVVSTVFERIEREKILEPIGNNNKTEHQEL